VTTHGYPPPGIRNIITFSVMLATMMNSLDTTIANVALPHIQGSLSASQEEITWILTSYIIASAIFTPLSGWLADRIGQKRVMFWSIIGFTLASGLCGIATNLNEIVAFRLIQGICGAALVPISQAILLDINPPERHGPAMAIWGMGAIVGPIIGPTLGGWLTDNLNWRWVFYINLPFGALCAVGLGFMSDHGERKAQRLDILGFAMLGLAIACFQLMLDRGQQLDWFNSLEICAEATLAAFFFYMFLAHTLTTEHPFVNLGLFKDRNFMTGTVIGLFLGIILFSVLALLPPMLEHLMGYPVVLTGLVTAPRGIGTMASMFFAGQLIRRMDPRVPLLIGLAACCLSTWLQTGFSLEMDSWLIIVGGLIQGVGTGFVFLSISALAFATIEPRLRNEAAAMFTLIRAIGSALGISVLQALTIRNASIVHSRLVEGVRPDNPILQWRMPDFDFDVAASVARMNVEISRQASMVSYIDSFYVLLIGSILMVPMLLYARPPRRSADSPAAPVHMD
jgi:DHA2 family multidrug resistance protein